MSDLSKNRSESAEAVRAVVLDALRELKLQKPDWELTREQARALKLGQEPDLEQVLEQMTGELSRELARKLARELGQEPDLEQVLEQAREVERRERERALELEKDSWVRRLRLAEKKHIQRINSTLMAIAGVVLTLSWVFGLVDTWNKPLSSPIFIGVFTAFFFWLLVSYGDHELRKIRVKKGWYGSNAMEVYELMQFIRENASNDNNDDNPPRRFFNDHELSEHTTADDEVTVPERGLGAR